MCATSTPVELAGESNSGCGGVEQLLYAGCDRSSVKSALRCRMSRPPSRKVRKPSPAMSGCWLQPLVDTNGRASSYSKNNFVYYYFRVICVLRLHASPCFGNFYHVHIIQRLDQIRVVLGRSWPCSCRQAVHAFIRENGRPPVVLDIGCGTGLLSMLAVRAGAAEVYGCELYEPLAQIAREVTALNCGDSIKASIVYLLRHVIAHELYDRSSPLPPATLRTRNFPRVLATGGDNGMNAFNATIRPLSYRFAFQMV